MKPLPQWYEKLKILKEYGKLELVEKELKGILEKGEDPFALELMGDVYFERDEREKAWEMYRRAKEIFIEEGEYARAVAMLHKERLSKLDKSLDRILEFEELLWKAGLKEKAKKYIVNSIKNFAFQEKRDEVEKLLRVLIERVDDGLDLKLILSKILFMNGKKEEARGILEKELKKAEEKRDIRSIEKITEVLDLLQEGNE